MDFEVWLEKANNKIETLSNNSIFVLKDLFVGVEWNRLKVGDRMELGRRFKNAVNRRYIENVIYIGKAANNSAQYQVKKNNK